MAVSDTSPGAYDAAFLGRLKERYLAAGYSFVTLPEAMPLPSEFGGYIPDAVASRDGQHIAIEVKSARQPSLEAMPLQKLRDIVEQNPGWKFSVAYTHAEDDIEAGGGAPASTHSIGRRLTEVERLSQAGFLRPAFVMAWPLLEAVAQGAVGNSDVRPLKPGTVVQSLEMDGHVSASDGARLRELVKLRNQIIHGNLEAEPLQGDIEFMLAIVRSVVSSVQG